ncbi:MAG TPA: hypothetical protein VGK39_07020 [Cyclobacteriaceae bacterium]
MKKLRASLFPGNSMRVSVGDMVVLTGYPVMVVVIVIMVTKEIKATRAQMASENRVCCFFIV